ncbi:MAG: aldehyde dehydrogenase family protein [Planctomycetota bacterium]|jgi:acyl-CoA reductase-like NAD-dependent aldehyde dehydrogenase
MSARPLRIGAERRQTSEVEVVTNPFDGSAVDEVCVGGPGDMDDAIAAAAGAAADMRRLSGQDRARILAGVASLLTARAEEIATLMARESGKPITLGRAEVARAVTTFTLGANEARGFAGAVQPVDLGPAGEDRTASLTRVPRGPVAAISPFNFPLNLVAHKLAPAIAVGAPVVLKPPPQSPLTALLLADVLDEVGLPANALSVVHCAPEVAQRMVEDDRMAVLSFTGSDTVGWTLKSLAGKKQVILELGGNAPCVLDEDTDLDRAMGPILGGAWAHAGQVCIKVQRVYAHASLYDEFLERFVAGTRAVPVGDPLDERTVVGPLIEPVHVERVLDWVEQAVEGGATRHCGGEVEGQVVHPVVLTGTTPDMRVCKDEVFGPVTVVERVDSFEAGLAAANAGRFGLQAGVFTRDRERAMQACSELDFGGVMINDVPTFRADGMPYGGRRDSGFGREGVRYAMEELTEPKLLVMRGL